MQRQTAWEEAPQAQAASSDLEEARAARAIGWPGGRTAGTATLEHIAACSMGGGAFPTTQFGAASSDLPVFIKFSRGVNGWGKWVV